MNLSLDFKAKMCYTIFMKIQIYSTTTCPYCKMEKAYLDEKGIKYENFFVDQDEKKADEMIQKSGQMGVPVTIITNDKNEETLIVGFDKKRIDKELNII